MDSILRKGLFLVTLTGAIGVFPQSRANGLVNYIPVMQQKS